jgi:hypothetical protein
VLTEEDEGDQGGGKQQHDAGDRDEDLLHRARCFGAIA